MNTREKKLAMVALLLSFAGGVVYTQVFDRHGRVAGPTVSDPPILGGDEPPVIHKFTNGEAMDSSGRPLFEIAKGIPARAALPEPEIIQPVPVFPERPVELVLVEPPRQLLPTPPPVTPQIPLQYTGYARDAADQMIAFIETTGGGIPAGHYNLREKDFILGQFRVNKISVDSVEIEDMGRPESDSGRKRTIAINAMIASRK